MDVALRPAFIIYQRLRSDMNQPVNHRSISFVDLKGQFEPVREQVRQDFDRVLDTMHLFLGPNVEAFEKDYARYCGTRHCLGVGTGTDALLLALLACGIGAGDEVITPSHTFIATWEAIALAGAQAVLTEVEPDTLLMSVQGLEAKITPRTKAIMPVHLYGQMVDMNPILELAKRHNLKVIEDASQAHGATYKGRRVGSLGDLGCFSFYYSKNLGACGEAGGVVTSSDELAERIRAVRNHGGLTKYKHDYLGTNSRLDEMQAVILKHKLPLLDGWNQRRRELAALYAQGLKNSGVTLPGEHGLGDHVYHLYVIQCDRRDDLLAHLSAHKVGAGIHYPIPIHQQKAYLDRGGQILSLPVTEAAVQRILSLPMHPCLSDDDVAYVCDLIHQFYGTAQ